MSYDRVDAPIADVLIVDDTQASLRLLSKRLTEQEMDITDWWMA
jgi:hypothetical protein